MAAGGTTTTTFNDGKVTQYNTLNPLLEINGQQFPQQSSLTAPLHMSNVLFDKINAPFIALGYLIEFDNR